ncbi:hypothetical protein PL11_002280 [Lentilactobacillus curieae]|uniref:D-alanyl-D-alanine carboxypeptidase n=1 Tax=Lentilactobacillus curieae TaxID=1138822 RepID=A0A1S6QL00_9LACO|nr:hypothetical protein PL11_002280 [Lentilactobacillus curieae]
MLLLASVVISVIGLTTINSSAKSKGATVVSTRKIAKTPNRLVSGYLYTTASLTKKAHNADNYPRTTFYTYRSATIRKANGNKAVYYYVKNGNGRVKGWIWRGYLVRTFNFTKQRAELRHILNLINSISLKNRLSVIRVLESINKHDSLASLIKKLDNLSGTLINSNDISKIKEINQTIRKDGVKLIQLTQQTLNKTYKTIENINQITDQVYNFTRFILNLLP